MICWCDNWQAYRTRTFLVLSESRPSINRDDRTGNIACADLFDCSEHKYHHLFTSVLKVYWFRFCFIVKDGVMDWKILIVNLTLSFSLVSAGLNFYISQQESFRVLGMSSQANSSLFVRFFILKLFRVGCWISICERWKHQWCCPTLCSSCASPHSRALLCVGKRRSKNCKLLIHRFCGLWTNKNIIEGQILNLY